MKLSELNSKYFTVHASRKKKGAGKGYKVTYKTVWRDGVKPRDYVNELAEADSIAAGRLLCNVEFADLMNDRWWDVPNYRAEHLRTYRSRITSIRKQYGLRSTDVAEFMRVG